jgi:cell wall-associated NlpC family hydrolase
VPSVPNPLPPVLRRIAIIVAATTALPISTAFAADRTADRSLAEQARISLTQAATRMVDGTREVGLFALSLVGIDYRLGGDSPERGLDCSGLIRYVFQQVTGVTLPRTAQELSRIGLKVRPDDLAPGDLVFFNTRRFAFSHVGIYLGNGRFIHAPSNGGEVGVATLSSAYWQRRYNGARRLVGVLPALMPALISPAEAHSPEPPSGSHSRQDEEPAAEALAPQTPADE